VGRIRVQGKRETLAVFEALDAALPDLDTWLPRFHDALEALDRADFKTARAGFMAVEEARGGEDGPSQVYLAILDELDAHPPAMDDWSPVIETRK